MFQYDAFITLDFQKILPACRQEYFHLYIFQLIQLRNLGTKYWVYGVARKLGFGENSVWSSTPRLAREGLSNMLEG